MIYPAKAATKHTGTFAATTRAAAIDMGEIHDYRYVNSTGVPNANSGTYTAPGNGTYDMGETNTYRYVNTTNADIRHTVTVRAVGKSYGSEVAYRVDDGAWHQFSSDDYDDVDETFTV